MGMIFIVFILVVIGVVIYFSLRNSDEDGAAALGKLALGGAIFLSVCILGYNSYTIIPAGFAGGQILFGNVYDQALPEGFHIINPLVEIQEVDIKTQSYSMTGGGDKEVEDNSSTDKDDAMNVLSADGLTLTIDVSILYRVETVRIPSILKTLGLDYKEKLIRPLTRSAMRQISANYLATDLYSSKREEYNSRVMEYLIKELEPRGITVENVLIRNIVLPATVRDAIESKIQMKQEAERMQFVLQKENQEAERKVVEAKGIADFIRIVSEPVTAKYLEYKKLNAMESLSHSANSKVIFWDNKGVPYTFTNGF